MGVTESKYEGKLMYVAEDDEYSFILIKEFLSGTGFIIQHAGNGDILVDMVKKKVPDIILLDINMPQKNGLNALKEIRNMGVKIPVIAETAYAMPDERQLILDSGCDEYISKPIYKSQMMNLIDKVLQK
ncbi:response regulator [Saccharicrinis sp. FJH62]|uniref:response regulator n=1 Tax=Saccharicrinis sp. FJH62 TaxID=3344657 RepID=UPI0035D3FAA4